MPFHLPFLRIGGLAALLFGTAVGPAAELEPGTIRLQLKWSHQFQFAGYYAALEKGFFREEGLEVEIIEGNADRPPLDMVLSGKADFGVSDADVLHARMQGAPVVVCAAIFQHSPYIVMSRHDSGIRVPADLIDRTVMISNDQGGVQHLAMLKREGLPIDRIKVVPHTWRLDDLIDGRVDAISAYITAEPSQMRARGVEPFVMKASDYGVDFYGDTLFTREEVARDRAAEVEAMVRATRKGWHYALEHREEMIAHILTLPGVRERGITAYNLNYEADAMEPLICAELVEIGHMNPGRWTRMARTYLETGVAQPPQNPNWFDGFLFHGRREARPLVSLAPYLGVATLAAFIVLVWIVTLRRKVEQRTREIQRSAETQRLILDRALDAVIGVGRDDLIVEWHPRASEIFGLPEEQALGTSISYFLPSLDHHLNDSGKPAGDSRFELEARRADGTRFPVELSLSVLPSDREVSLILFVRDIAGQRSLEEKLRQSQKLQAIGQLAGGIAHDFNNLLTVIRGNAAIIRDEASLNPEHGGALDEIVAASERASSLTAQLLAFSRQQPMQPKVFPANACIENIVRMLGRLIGEDVRIETSLSSPSPLLRADQAMIEQVILNLAVNGRDAMPNGGVLSLSTRVIPVSEETARLHHREVAGDYLCIEVRDTGTGIAPEHLPRLFEPFFTTKDVGKGTGLGLATVFGIVEQHGGWVTVESRVGGGSRFTVWLPCHRETASPETGSGRAPAGSSRASVPSGHETILLVEDEELVRLVGRRLLTRQGYRVIEARSGRHALELWKDHSGEIDLLLTDVVMPEGVSGHELATRLQQERPGLKVIYTSGYAAEIFRGEAPFPEDAAFVGKPYRPEELLGTIRSVLDGNAVEPLALPS